MSKSVDTARASLRSGESGFDYCADSLSRQLVPGHANWSCAVQAITAVLRQTMVSNRTKLMLAIYLLATLGI